MTNAPFLAALATFALTLGAIWLFAGMRHRFAELHEHGGDEGADGLCETIHNGGAL